MQNTPKEWSLIDRIRYRVQRQNDHTKVPLGDDAFVFRNYPGYSVICQDMMVEGVHFDLDYFSAFDLGYKSLAVNLSDIAAMGALPHFAQVSLALPKKLNESWLDDFYKGMTSLADDYHMQVAGGDLAASPDRLVVDVSVHGSCENPLTRKGAKPGDLLLCSGPLGLSFTGMTALQKNLAGFEAAKERHLRPKPRLDLVAKLQKHHDRIHALMDCSDGLVNDALLLRPENCGFHLFAENLPLHTESQSLAVDLHLNPQDIVLWGGEDYELLMAIHPEDYEHFPEWKMIGQFTEDPRVFVTHPDHHEDIKEFKGWKHFPG
ncbi:thiamine-phosphate kinase [Bdellovibrio bacteriovorus]|uniref:thiamine-phosphate kinase n=1 Tax=Bdellovibrio bacteriovorus TaxID=959 RepID=UPI003A802C38